MTEMMMMSVMSMMTMLVVMVMLLLVMVRFCHHLLLQENPIVYTSSVQFFGYI